MPIFAGEAVSLIVLALWIFCIVDVFTTVDGTTRNLPKIGWIFVVLFLPMIGSILWLVAGRPETQYRRPANTRYSEYDRPGRHVAGNPDDDDEFLRRCRERAEEQRRQYKAKQQEDES